jgi:hypothetical protein
MELGASSVRLIAMVSLTEREFDLNGLPGRRCDASRRMQPRPQAYADRCGGQRRSNAAGRVYTFSEHRDPPGRSRSSAMEERSTDRMIAIAGPFAGKSLDVNASPISPLPRGSPGRFRALRALISAAASECHIAGRPTLQDSALVRPPALRRTVAICQKIHPAAALARVLGSARTGSLDEQRPERPAQSGHLH